MDGFPETAGERSGRRGASVGNTHACLPLIHGPPLSPSIGRIRLRNYSPPRHPPPPPPPLHPYLDRHARVELGDGNLRL